MLESITIMGYTWKDVVLFFIAELVVQTCRHRFKI